MKLSVVIPTHNEHSWLKDTFSALEISIKNASLGKNTEVIFVDDGSTDSTKSTVEGIIRSTNSCKVVYIHQKQGGRFLARKTGITASTGSTILLIDSRVHIGPNSLKFVFDESFNQPKEPWNAHVNIKKGNYLSMFWDVIAKVAWRKYFIRPRRVSYGAKEFEYYPKGTTCFLVPKGILLESVNFYEKNYRVGKDVNDDTVLLRHMVESTNFNLSPHFNCVYFSRTSLNKFTKHTFHRGKVFSDGFLKNRNRYTLALISYFLSFPSFALLVVLIGWGLILWTIVAMMATSAFALMLLISKYSIPFKDALNFVVVAPVFALYYGAGLWFGLYKIITSKDST